MYFQLGKQQCCSKWQNPTFTAIGGVLFQDIELNNSAHYLWRFLIFIGIFLMMHLPKFAAGIVSSCIRKVIIHMTHLQMFYKVLCDQIGNTHTNPGKWLLLTEIEKKWKCHLGSMQGWFTEIPSFIPRKMAWYLLQWKRWCLSLLLWLEPPDCGGWRAKVYLQDLDIFHILSVTLLPFIMFTG